jgi:hypothetical protein
VYLPLVDKLWKTKKGRRETQTKADLDLTAQAVNTVDDVIVSTNTSVISSYCNVSKNVKIK